MSPRLAIDWRISDLVPIVVGTKLTVRYIVSMIVAGKTWDDVIAMHPELTREDIWACVFHALEIEMDSESVDTVHA